MTMGLIFGAADNCPIPDLYDIAQTLFEKRNWQGMAVVHQNAGIEL